MAKDISGTLRDVTLNGVSFRVMADTNVTSNLTTENEAIPTSGGNMRKVTRKAAIKESVVLGCNLAEFELLKALHASQSVFPMAVTYADGTTHYSEGGINCENHESEENRASVILQPTRDWEAFIAN